MTLILDHLLPEQPAEGQVRFQPLGGDGYTAPQSEYIGSIKEDGDASGGYHAIRVTMDPQYVSLVNFCAFGLKNTTSSHFFRMTLSEVGGVQLSIFGQAVYGLIGLGTTQARLGALWSPPPMLMSATEKTAGVDPMLAVYVPNNTGVELGINVRVLNFAKDVREKVPLHQILGSVPRPSTLI